MLQILLVLVAVVVVASLLVTLVLWLLHPWEFGDGANPIKLKATPWCLSTKSQRSAEDEESPLRLL